MSIKEKFNILLENQDIDQIKVNIPIKIASKGNSEYIYCSNSCIYLGEGRCTLFEQKLEKDELFKRNNLCIKSDL